MTTTITATTEVLATLVTKEVRIDNSYHDRKILNESRHTGIFTVEEIARRFRGQWAMDRDCYGTTVAFQSIHKGKYSYETIVNIELDRETRQAIWVWYTWERRELWEEQARSRRLNRDVAVAKMTLGTPTERAKVALEYPEYRHLVPTDGIYYGLYLRELKKLEAALVV